MILKKGSHYTPEQLKRITEANQNPELRKRQSETKKLSWSNPKIRARRMQTLRTEEHKKRNSEAQLKAWANLETRNSRLSGQRSTESRKNRSISKIRNWQDPEYRERQSRSIMKGSRKLPNKPEIYLLELLEKWFPGEWIYCGNGDFTLGRKCPDYRSRTSPKLIELFGERWHKSEEVEIRKAYFKSFGYDTFIIWFNDLKNLEEVKNKLQTWMETDKCP